MNRTFFSNFKRTDLKKEINRLDIRLIESESTKKLLPMIDKPVTNLSQKERGRVSKLKEMFPEYSKKKSGEEIEFLLFIHLTPLFYLSVEKLKYHYLEKPKITDKMDEVLTKRILDESIGEVKSAMQLSSKIKNVFTKEGRKITTLYELMSGEYTFFITSMPKFDGLSRVLGRGEKPIERLLKDVSDQLKQIELLEYPLLPTKERPPLKQFVTINQHIANKYKKLKEDIISFAYMNPDGLDSIQLENIYKRLKRKEIKPGDLKAMVQPVEPNVDYLSTNLSFSYRSQEKDLQEEQPGL